MTVSRAVAWRWLALAVVLAACGLRLYRAGSPSLSVDEIISMYEVQGGVGDLLQMARGDVHPPLYFLSLWVWRHLSGSSEFAVRFLSATPGVVAVALVYVLGRRIFAASVGALASLSAAVSPFLVHYSQEVRMYSLVLALSLAGVYVLLRALEARRFVWWVAWALLTATAVLVDYTALAVLAVADAYLLYRLFRERGPWWHPLAVAHAAAAVLFVPWMLLSPLPRTALGQYTATGTSLGYVLERTAAFFTGVAGMSGSAAIVSLAGLGVLLVLGTLRGRAPAEGRGLLLVYLLLPVVMAYVFARQGRDFAPRYVIVAVPPFLVLVAAGVMRLAGAWRPLLAVGALVFFVPNVVSLKREYYDPFIQRDDIRGMAAWLDERVRPNDVVVFVSGPSHTMYPYYGTQTFAVVGLPEEQPLDEGRTAARLAELKERFERIWLVLLLDDLVDPERFVEGWLLSHNNLMDSVALSGLEVEGFDTRPLRLDEPPEPTYRTSATLGGVVRLLGADVDQTALAERGLLFVTLYWESLAPMDDSYWVFVHLVDAEGRRWAQKDNRPGYDQLHTNLWQPGDLVRDGYRLVAQGRLPPGSYRLLAGMYRADGVYLETEGGEDYVVLGELQVGPGGRALTPGLLVHSALLGLGADGWGRGALDLWTLSPR